MLNSVRSLVKKLLYSKTPGFAGRYRYFGDVVHFEPGAFIFDLVAEQGIYESELLQQIQLFLAPGDTYFDVGANVGFMSIPILKTHPTVNVVSFEPSPNSLPLLLRTHAACSAKARWTIIGKAAGSAVGSLSFSVSDKKFAGYDGLIATQRHAQVHSVEVPVTTLDREWEALNKPKVGCLKLDIEGAEMSALAGAEQLIRSCRPAILMEWYEPNFKWFGVKVTDLLDFAAKYHYQIISTPQLAEINSELHLRMTMALSGNIALIPKPIAPD
jgi:FkbM family methyltransferase